MGMSKITTEDFIARAKKVHGDKYDYSKSVYVNAKTKLCIICPEHAEFWKTSDKHINSGQGCPKCAKVKQAKSYMLTLEDFIARAKKVHGDKYDYSKFEYKGSFVKGCIICPKHAEFWQVPTSHVNNKAECPKCAKIKQAKSYMLPLKEFIAKANLIHNNKYDYSKFEYNGSFVKGCVICPIHNEFWVTPNNHTNHKSGCPKCIHIVSKPEIDLQEFIISIYGGEIILNSRRIIPPKELDIYIPTLKLAIEFNGVYWHSEKIVGKYHHQVKSDLCEALDIQLLHIFEHEWNDDKEFWKQILIDKIYQNDDSYLRNNKHWNRKYGLPKKCGDFIKLEPQLVGETNCYDAGQLLILN